MTRLAVEYGWRSKVKMCASVNSNEELEKVLADCYEAYFGVAWTCVKRGEISLSALEDYFQALFSADVFPGLSEQIQEWQECKNRRRKRKHEKLQAKHERRTRLKL